MKSESKKVDRFLSVGDQKYLDLTPMTLADLRRLSNRINTEIRLREKKRQETAIWTLEAKAPEVIPFFK